MKFLKPILLTLTVALFSSSTIVAQKLEKVATVDMKKLFDEYHLTKGAQAKVKAAQAEIQAENNEKLKEIRAIEKQIQTLTKKIEDPVLAVARKKGLLRERQLIANKGNALENNRRDWINRRQRAINENIVTEMRKILGQINEKVDNYARKNDIDFVLDKSARGTTQTKFLIFSKDSFEITTQLLETLNSEAPKDGAKPLGVAPKKTN